MRHPLKDVRLPEAQECDLLKEWPLQPYTLHHSRLGEGDDGVNSVAARSGRAVRRILNGEFLTLSQKDY